MIMIDKKPLLIGGVGGSGTRLVAEIVSRLGIYIGKNLNESLDNLDWGGNRSLLLDKTKSSEERQASAIPGLRRFVDQMFRLAVEAGDHSGFWASKVPGCFYYLPAMAQMSDQLHYIHVIRHGLDMAFSGNHNQLRNWGPLFDLAPGGTNLPCSLLKYWVRANTYALEQCRKHLHGRYLLLRYEDLCMDSENSIRQIAEFAETLVPESEMSSLTRLVKSAGSVGRYKKLGRPEMFDPADLSAVREFGYTIEW